MVANRRRNNPRHGSFSIFESVSGGFKIGRGYIEVNKRMFYFGHFTTLKDKKIVLDQSPARSKLLIELIVWDYTQRVFNFYELLSINGRNSWFYRGNSKDIYLDNQKLHLQKNLSKPQFGRRLRCSACHISGGPIIKEIELPHNDWWNDHRNLLFYPNNLSNEVGSIVKNLKGARLLSGLVKKSINALDLSKEYWNFKMKSSVQEILRPLFLHSRDKLNI